MVISMSLITISKIIENIIEIIFKIKKAQIGKTTYDSKFLNTNINTIDNKANKNEDKK